MTGTGDTIRGPGAPAGPGGSGRPRDPVSRPPRLRPSTGAGAGAAPARVPRAAARPGARREARGDRVRGEEVWGSDLLPFEDSTASGGPDANETPDPPEIVAPDLRAARAGGGGVEALAARVRDALPGPAGARPPGGLLRAASGAVLAVLAVSLGIVVLLAVRDAPQSRLSSTGEGALTEAGPETEADAPAEASGAAEQVGAGTADSAVPEPGQAEAPTAPDPSTAPTAEPVAEPPVVAPPDARVTVLGVGGSGSAEPTAATLREAGWQVRLVATYRGTAPTVPTVFHVPGREAEAALLAARVGAVAVRPAPASLSDSDLTLVVR